MLNPLHFFKPGKETNDDLRRAIDQSFCYATFSVDGILKECNDRFTQLFAYDTSSQLVGHHHRMLVDEAYAASAEYLDFWKQLSSGTTLSGEFHRKNKHKKDIYIQAAYTPLLEKGKVKGIVKIASDITEQKNIYNTSAAIRQALDQSFAFIQFDPSGNILEANEQFVDTMGYANASELKGQHHSIFVSPETKASQEYATFWEQLRMGRVQQGTFSRQDKHGKEVWLEAAYSPVTNAYGSVESVVKIATNITVGKNNSDHLKDITSVIDLSFGYIQFDPEGHITNVNSNFHKLMGYQDEAQVLGQHHSMFVSPQYARSTEYQAFWKALKAGETQQGEFQRVSKSGQDIWIQAAYTPVRNQAGKITSIIKIAADITSSKMAFLQAKQDLRTEVLNNVREISSAIEQIASGARTQAQRTDESSEQIEHAMEAAGEMSGKAVQITEMANLAEAESHDGAMAVSKMVSSMQALTQATDQARESINELERSAQEINRVLKVLKEIATQTNMLALNASIEAAQAGAYGRGFEVIAKEVRALAESSAKSATEIEQLVNSVNNGSKAVSKAMHEVTNGVSGGFRTSSDVEGIFQRMSKSTKETSGLAGVILEAAQAQKVGIQDIIKNIEGIIVIAEETAAGTEEVSAAAKALESQVGQY